MKNDFKSSFTLIELLVVIGIIIIFASVSLPSYNNFTAKKRLEAQTEKVADVLELTKKKANSSDYSQCGGPNITPKLGDKFSFVITSSTEYKIIPDCLTGTPYPIQYQTKNNIEFPTPTIQVDFKTLNGGSNASCFVLKNTKTTSCRYVKISQSSLIEEDSCNCSSCCP